MVELRRSKTTPRVLLHCCSRVYLKSVFYVNCTVIKRVAIAQLHTSWNLKEQRMEKEFKEWREFDRNFLDSLDNQGFMVIQ